ncbi:MAG: hypothetical protein J0H14_13395 [Alphaproteobacteria bacterium]|nr:hypothetical protein [Alphaproteobacteria bacterium]
MVAAHADWSVDPRKRWVSVGRRDAHGWRIAAPRPVGDVTRFLPALLEEAAGSPVALGADLPLGLPRHYAACRPEAGFIAFLRGLALDATFFDVAATLAEIGPDRPFYPMRGVKGMSQALHAAALGLAGPLALRRACDHATSERPAGAPLFWTLGPNQVGKAAVSAWREMLIPALASGLPIRIWPFEGAYRELLAPGTIALAETYPAEALRHLGLRLAGSKRRQRDRAGLAAPLLAAISALDAAPDAALGEAIINGFGADAAGEDRFDSLLGVLCVLNVLAGNRPDGAPDDPWIARWEGWVLGQTAMPAGRAPDPPMMWR